MTRVSVPYGICARMDSADTVSDMVAEARGRSDERELDQFC